MFWLNSGRERAPKASPHLRPYFWRWQRSLMKTDGGLADAVTQRRSSARDAALMRQSRAAELASLVRLNAASRRLSGTAQP